VTKVFPIAPRLKEKHVTLPPFNQMRVKLAAVFCANMNDLFDYFNSSTLKCRSAPNRSALSSASPHLERLMKLNFWLDNVKVIDRQKGNDLANRFKCIQGWQQKAIEALSQLRQSLCVDSSVKFLFTRRINQDPLENFFV
jgi:hypothetical protein